MCDKLLKLYALIVCLLMTLTLFVISVKVYDIGTDFFLYNYKHINSMKSFRSNEAFLASLKAEEKKFFATRTVDEVTKEMNHRKTAQIAKIKSTAITKFFDLSGSLLLSIIFFAIHWRLYKTEKFW